MIELPVKEKWRARSVGDVTAHEKGDGIIGGEKSEGVPPPEAPAYEKDQGHQGRGETGPVPMGVLVAHETFEREEGGEKSNQGAQCQ